eukprot:234871_1
MSDNDIKLQLLRGLIAKNVNLSDIELSELTGFSPADIQRIKNETLFSSDNAPEQPLSWDYAFVFDVGSKDPKKKIKPKKKDIRNKPEDDNDPEWDEGMDQDKHYGQIFNNIWQKLEAAKLSVEPFTSYTPSQDQPQSNQEEKKGRERGWTNLEDEDEKETQDCFMFLLVGITEQNLKSWADERDTDILIDPVGGVTVGRSRNFPLATRTKLEYDSHETNATLDISNWNQIYGKYSKQANQSVYKHYKRLPGVDDRIETPFDERTRLRIIYESIITDTNEGGAEVRIVDCLKNKKHPLRAVFPLHNEAKLSYFANEWINSKSPSKWMWCPLQEVRDYFGEPVAFYFAFLQFYLRWLIAPAVAGLACFVWQLVAGEVAVGGISLLGFFIIFWSVAFVDFWARAENRYRLQWGMTRFQQKAVARPQFEGEWQHNVVTGVWTEEFPLFNRFCRVSAIYTFVTLWVSCCVVSVVFILLQRDKNPNDIGLKVALGVANGVMIFIFDIIYKLVAVYGNEWENHRTEEDFQNAYIYKSFVFKFVNSFASLFYLGFIRPLQNGLYYYVHFYDGVCGDAPSYMSQFVTKYDTSVEDYEWYVDHIRPGMQHYAECVDKGDDKACIDLIHDNEAWTVALSGFYPAPLTPLLAIVNNIIEMNVHATNLVKTSQRPHPTGSFGLGSWNGILSFFSIIAVGTNVALITWRTKLPTTLLEGIESAHWVFFSALSILLGIIVAAEKYAIADVPMAVEQAIERQRLVESVLIMGAGVEPGTDQPPDDDDDGNIQFDPSLQYIDFTILPRLPPSINKQPIASGYEQ